MARALAFQFQGAELALEMNKVDRSGLYGFVEHEVLDGKNRRCISASLASDGQTIVGSGGSSFAQLAPDGTWLEKAKLTPVDPEGKKITPVPSSFSAPILLAATATIDDYLACNIRAVYQLTSAGDMTPLMEELKKGTIFSFDYSYRGGLEPDRGFLLLAGDGTAFLAVGSATKMEFVGLDQPAQIEEETDADAESEEIDFGML